LRHDTLDLGADAVVLSAPPCGETLDVIAQIAAAIEDIGT
jgi:hypothetical protein